MTLLCLNDTVYYAHSPRKQVVMKRKVCNVLMYLCIVAIVACLAIFLGVQDSTTRILTLIGVLIAVIGGTWAYAKRD